MPEGNIYIPVQVGPAKDDFSGFVRDNTGENISEKNPNYCELTAQYWAWKNRKADVKGLVHYRRLFSKGKRMLGASHVSFANPEECSEWSGFKPGGVPPVGYPEQPRSFLDEDLFNYSEVWAAAGTDHAFFPISPAELMRITGGESADIKK